MASSSSNPQDESLMPFSCYLCRNRKVKCDRLSPECSRCSGTGAKCQYPATRKRPMITATRPKVKDLESRLIELEHRLKASREDEGYQSFKPFEASDTQVSETGRFEQLPSQDIIEDLTNVFFTKVPFEGQYIHPSRYLASLYLPPHMQPPMCLQYIVMARAALFSPPHKHLAEPFYRRARHYLEADEQKGEGEYFVTVAHTQCCVLMSHFEVHNMWFSRSSMSTSKSVRLAQILGLHQLDSKGWNRSPTLPPPKDWCELEERRRTLWAIFCSDKNTSGTTGWPSLMDVKRINTLLPASEEAFHLGMEEPSTTLSQALTGYTPHCSPFACRIITTHLFHECLDHTYQEYSDSETSDIQNSPFWKRHQDLDTGLATAFITLPGSLRDSSSQEATTINLQLHTASICIHRVGTAQARKHNITVEILTGTEARLLPAADAIFGIVASSTDVSATFRNPLVAFAAYMATYVFLEDYIGTQNSASEMKMTALMDLMITIGHGNPVTASAAVQMAHELRKTGIDPTAVDKVQDLMATMDLKGPLMGQQVGSEGRVVFCPFETAGPAPPGVPSEMLRSSIGGLS